MRNNQRRLGPHTPGESPAPLAAVSQMAYAVPTEFVELPSDGKFYSSDHPLYNQKTVEIKFMTAKEEDILSSQALLKNGLAVNRFLESILVEDIDVNSLLVGDRGAILVAARISGYGNDYKVEYPCPICTKRNEIDFDLKEVTINKKCLDQEFLGEKHLTFNEETCTFDFVLPTTGVHIGLKLLDGDGDTDTLAKENQDSLITTMLSSFLVKVNDNMDPKYVQGFIESLPARDSKYLRNLYPEIVPSVRLLHYFTCDDCYHQKDVEVPLTAEFFWPE